MGSEGFTRKLTAILCADVKGYARLMADDEKATVHTLQSYRQIMNTFIRTHRGRIVDSPGDYILAEFPSVVEAVRCAVEIQRELRFQNDKLPVHRRMTFRIGINLGDVIEDEGEIYGEGLNIGDRMQSLAGGGGICISGTAYDQVKNMLPLEYRYLGRVSVKNIVEPVRAYTVVTDTTAPVTVEGAAVSQNWRRASVVLAGLVIAIAGMIAFRAWYLPVDAPPAPVSSERGPGHDVHGRPSIAVLPFENMSGEKKYEVICDGITDGVTDSLSKMPDVLVIAHHSATAYKKREMGARQIGRELGVRYLMEGGIQEAGTRLRISARLVDAVRGTQIWAEHYDRELTDLFTLQDEIALKILTAMQVKLLEGEQARIYGRGTRSLGAYIKICQGRKCLLQFSREGNSTAREMARESMALDPNYPMSYWLLAATHVIDIWLGISPAPRRSLHRAEELTHRALSLDHELSDAHGLLSNIFILKRLHEKAITEADKAVSLNPNSADALMFRAVALNYAGRHEEAVRVLRKALRLNPFPPSLYYLRLGVAYRDAGHYEDAIKMVRTALAYDADNVYAHTCLASSLSLSGSHKEARHAAREVLRINPRFSLDNFEKVLPYKNRSDIRRVINALRQAGLE